MLARGWALYTPPSPTFADVPASSTFYTYIETVANKGIASGYPCGGPGEQCDPQHRPYFRPGNNATRGQISKMLYITLDLHQSP
ncbi:MAG TPA: S-layer homology domain-containing protein [Ktedonobacteraceae bacterium]|nr:S-layer homology domain-containing protein [Ktedonobacteraceae bacterium]